MAAFNFPNSPSVGQVANGYAWDGEKWVGTGVGNPVATIYVSETPPAAGPGSLWYESDTGLFFARIQDADSTQWVQLVGGVPEWMASKNYIINGAMQISQENGATAGTAFGYYPVDQFIVTYSNAGTQTSQQVTSFTPGGSPNRLRVTATVADAAIAAGDYLYAGTRVEGLRMIDLRFGSASAKTITLQFGVKAPAGTYCVAFKNAAADRVYVAEYVIAGGEANTDTIKSITLTGDATGTWATDNTAGLFVVWGLMFGATYQTAAGSWGAGSFYASSNQTNFMGTAGNVFELFDVSLTQGTIAPPFRVPDYASELMLCKRYWENMRLLQISAQYAAGTYGTVGMFTVEKRAAPTATLASNVSSNWTINASNPSMTTKWITCVGTTVIATTVIMDVQFYCNARL